ncbi:16S rRNA (guanine(527)-N(7))-methyltransferase RsmG [Qipengyuania sp.]|uniref:16S rRNA (guanine(527)-N(7))-methyltransferase RsmG n=1 Tax=Qipengyuania sp. TaxID=2004515 RepID=UPI0035C82F70
MIEGEGGAKIFVRERCDGAAFHKLETLVSLLVDENEHQNLIAKSSIDQIWLRHIADSIQLLDHVSRETGSWLDLGSGAGFPGLVIAVARPAMSVRLVESRRLRIEWLRHAAGQLGLKNCEVDGCDVKALPEFSVDVISARAFAPMIRLVSLSARFSTPETRWVLPKGRNAWQDVNTLDAEHREMFHVEPSCTDPEAGIVIGKGKLELAT